MRLLQSPLLLGNMMKLGKVRRTERADIVVSGRGNDGTPSTIRCILLFVSLLLIIGRTVMLLFMNVLNEE